MDIDDIRIGEKAGSGRWRTPEQIVDNLQYEDPKVTAAGEECESRQSDLTYANCFTIASKRPLSCDAHGLFGVA